MPRTKYLKKLKNLPVEIDECQSLIRDFQKQGKVRIQKFEADSKMEIKALDTYIKMIISSMPVEFLDLTLNDILIMETCDKEDNDSTNMKNGIFPAAKVSITTHKLRKTVSDDGYDTERGTSKPRIISTGAAKRTRSKSRTKESKIDDLQLLAIKNGRSVGVSPSSTSLKANMPNVIKPKVNPNSPMNILRRPRQGEMVLSLQGSPLLVSSVVQDETATINVPLQDGRVMSFVPKDKLHLSNIPALDPETMRQLSTLKGYIEQVFGSK